MDPLAHVRHALAAARAAGLTFDEAWIEVVELVPWSWRATLEDTASAWRDAYNGAGGHRLADVVELRHAAHEHDGQRRRGRARMVA